MKKVYASRKCVVPSCANSDLSHHMHTFPKLNNDDKGYERYLVWIQNSCNERLLLESPFALNRRFFYCGDHFDCNQYTSNNRQRLKRNAIPTESCPQPLALVDVQRYLRNYGVNNVEAEDMEVEEVLDHQEGNVHYFHFFEDVMEVEVSTSEFDSANCVGLHSFDNSANDLQLDISDLPSRSDDLQMNVEMSASEFDSVNCVGSHKVDISANVLEMEAESNFDNCVGLCSMNDFIVNLQSDNCTNELHMDVDCDTVNAVSSSLNDGEVLDVNVGSAVNKPIMPPTRIHSRCAVIGCTNNNATHSMFGFPRVSKIIDGQVVTDEMELKRCIEWIKFCKNQKLLTKDICRLHKLFKVCAIHFILSDFTSNMRKNLKKTAVPHINAPDDTIPNVCVLPASNENSNECLDRDDNVPVPSLDSFESCDRLRDLNSAQSKALASNFEEKMKSFTYETCSVCKETYLYYPGMKRAHRKKSSCWKFSAQNQMDPGVVPPELLGLTFIEEQLIARVHPVLSVYKLKGCQYGYKGNVINFYQDVEGFARQLPYRIADISSIVTVSFKNRTGDSTDFQVRAKKVHDALIWLKANNEFYSCIDISSENLQELPEDGNVYDSMCSFALGDSDNDSDVSEEENEDNSPGMIESSGVPFIPVRNQNQQVNAALNWPSMSGEPVSEFNPGFIMCAFPCLFPHGVCDLNAERTSKVKMHEYFKHLLSYEDGRFAKHQTFRFFAFNMWMRHTALSDGNVFVAKDSVLSTMNVEQLKAHLNDNVNARNKLMFMGSNLRGSKAYWKSRCGELKDMVEQIGLPTIFLTMSAADLYWPDLFRILTGKDIDDITMRERRTLLQENPVVVDLFFEYRLQCYIDVVLKPKYDVIDFWYRIEYQHRGSPHVHGLYWLKNAPDVESLLNGTEEEKKKVTKYFDELVTAVNPNNSVSMPLNHPCEVLFGGVEDIETDLSQLLKKVQRHSKCTPGYCLRVDRKTKKTVCRFHFPFQLSEEAQMNCKEDSSEIEFVPERNDPLLNKFNPFIIATWRANIDIAPVLSKRAIIEYISKYVSKSEVSSKSLLEICDSVCNSLSSNDKAKRAIQKILIKNCVERDVSAQEVCHIMMGAKLFSAGGRRFVIVYTDSSQWLPVASDCDVTTEGPAKSSSTFMEKYANRPKLLEEFSLWDCAKLYNANTWRKTLKPNIVRVFPRLSLNDSDVNNEAYYRQKLLLFLPWTEDKPIMKHDGESWKSCFERNHVEQLMNQTLELNIVCEQLSDGEEEMEDVPVDSNEDWMIASRLCDNRPAMLVDAGRREVDLQHDWSVYSKKYESFGDLQYFENFIENQKKNTHDIENLPDFPDINFSAEQLSVKELMEKQIQSLLHESSNETLPKQVLVQGKAGTGKSLLIRYLVDKVTRQFGTGSILLLGPTGVAAVNVGGSTIHSALLISGKGQIQDLKGESARKFCDTIEKVKFVIIDEYSFISCPLLGMIDRRLRQGTGVNEPFGNLFIYLFGDYRQLPPVKLPPMFANSSDLEISKHGSNMFKLFDCFFVLTQCHRQKDTKFQELLDRLSVCQSTEEDYHVLRKRFTNIVNDAELKKFDNAIRLFSEKKAVAEYNEEKLRNLKDEAGGIVPVAVIPASHHGKGAKSATDDKADGLPSELHLARGAKIMLKRNLWVKKGLVNGTIGEIVDILYEDDKDPPHHAPRILMCKFNSYSGPGIGPDNLVPIGRVTASWKNESGQCSRQQFPVVLSYACTIHKSQGLTLDQAVIQIGKKEFSLGLTYVGLSRVKSLDGLLLESFPFKRLQNLKNRPELILRKHFEQRLNI